MLKLFSSKKKKTKLENIEDIEYLRFLEMGIEIRTVKMSKVSLAIDTNKDVILANKRIKKLAGN